MILAREDDEGPCVHGNCHEWKPVRRGVVALTGWTHICACGAKMKWADPAADTIDSAIAELRENNPSGIEWTSDSRVMIRNNVIIERDADGLPCKLWL